MIKIKHSIHVNGQPVHSKQGDYYNLLVRFSLCGERKNFSLGVTVPPCDWDPQGKCFAPGALNSPAARAITEYCTMLEDIVTRFALVEQRVPSMDEVTSAFREARGVVSSRESHSPKVTKLFLDYIAKQRVVKGWAEGTALKYATMRKHFFEFRPELEIEQVDDSLLMELFVWLTDERGLINSTKQKYVKFITAFLRWCVKEDLYHGTSHTSFRPKFRGGDNAHKDVIFLTTDELRAIIDFEPGRQQGRLDHIRDMFLFSCFTSLRFGDIKALRWSQVSDEFVTVVTGKTNDRLRINLNTHSRAILDKYRSRKYPEDRVFGPISNQNANSYLHELCRVCGISSPMLDVVYRGNERIERTVPKYELITFHSGRRSFITHALRLGIPQPVIMKFSGHHDLRMLKPYTAVVDELKAQEMAKFDNF